MKIYEKTIIATCILLAIISKPSGVIAQERDNSEATQFVPSKSQLFLGPSLMIFELSEMDQPMLGIALAYTWKFSRSWGLLFDSKYHSHSDYDLNQSDRVFQLTAGISFQPTSRFKKHKLSFDAHALAGIIRYSNIFKTIYGSTSYRITNLNTILGAGINYRLSNLFSLRLIQIELAATSYETGEDGRANLMICTGLNIYLPHH